MVIDTYEDGFTCIYQSNPRILKTVVNGNENTILFEMVNGDTIQYNLPKHFNADDQHVFMRVYMGQYGVDISEDGKRFFLHSWYAWGGLSCYEVDTGRLLWTVKKRHARKAYVIGDYIYCNFNGYGITKISIDNGEIVNRYPLVNDECFLQLDRNRFLAGMKRQTYRIFNTDFEELYSIPIDALKNKDIKNIHISSCELSGTLLTIRGYEATYEEQELIWLVYDMKHSGIIDPSVVKRKEELAAAADTDVQHYAYCHPMNRTVDIASYRM